MRNFILELLLSLKREDAFKFIDFSNLVEIEKQELKDRYDAKKL